MLTQKKKSLLFCLQFSISLVCGIEQIVEHDSPFRIYICERGWHALQYTFVRYIYIHEYICYLRSKSLNKQVSKFSSVLAKTGPGAFQFLFSFRLGMLGDALQLWLSSDCLVSAVSSSLWYVNMTKVFPQFPHEWQSFAPVVVADWEISLLPLALANSPASQSVPPINCLSITHHFERGFQPARATRLFDNVIMALASAVGAWAGLREYYWLFRREIYHCLQLHSHSIPWETLLTSFGREVQHGGLGCSCAFVLPRETGDTSGCWVGGGTGCRVEMLHQSKEHPACPCGSLILWF